MHSDARDSTINGSRRRTLTALLIAGLCFTAGTPSFAQPTDPSGIPGYLLIARELIESLNGRVDVSVERSAGTTVQVDLPLPVRASSPHPIADPEVDLTIRRALICANAMPATTAMTGGSRPTLVGR